MPQSAPQITKADLHKKYANLPKQTKAKLYATDSNGTPKIFTQIPCSVSSCFVFVEPEVLSHTPVFQELLHSNQESLYCKSLASEEGDCYAAECQGQDYNSVEDNSKVESKTEDDDAHRYVRFSP